MGNWLLSIMHAHGIILRASRNLQSTSWLDLPLSSPQSDLDTTHIQASTGLDDLQCFRSIGSLWARCVYSGANGESGARAGLERTARQSELKQPILLGGIGDFFGCYVLLLYHVRFPFTYYFLNRIKASLPWVFRTESHSPFMGLVSSGSL